MTTPADPLLEALVKDFGANYAFALDLLQEYRRDPKSVDASWRAYFDKALGMAPVAEQAPGTQVATEEAQGDREEPQTASLGRGPEGGPQARAPEAGPRAWTPQGPGADLPTLARQDVPAVAGGGPPSALARVSILPGDVLEPIRGGAVRIV